MSNSNQKSAGVQLAANKGLGAGGAQVSRKE